MTIENCKRCGTLYQKTLKSICTKCIQQEEEDYKKVRLYLKRHKMVEMTTVSEETGVDLGYIYEFLQQGRIVLDSATTSNYPCSNCDAPIQTGALCATCEAERHEIHKSLEAVSIAPTAVVENPAPKKAAFHTKS